MNLSNTNPQGSYASLGSIQRVPVPILAKGALAPPPGQLTGPYSESSVRIGFRQFGSGPDLLMIMGQHGTMTWWDPQLLTALAASFTVTIFDLPGVGYSAHLPSAPTVESYADVAAGLIYALQLKKPVVLGWGLGGGVALSLAERHAGSLSKLVLVDAMIGGSTALGVAKGPEAILSSPAVTPATLAGLMFPSDQSSALDSWLARALQIPSDDIVASGVDEQARVVVNFARDQAVVSGLRKIEVSALVIDGSQDAVVPTANSARLTALLPRRKIDDEAAAGYGVLVQEQSSLVSEISTFATG